MPLMNNDSLSISELAHASGLSTHTLRFYEKTGLLAPIARAANGHRRYAAHDVAWLAFVLRLKQTGMALTDIRTYAQLRARGDATLGERLNMLATHRQQLARQLDELHACAQALDDKMTVYRQMIALIAK